MKLVLDREQRDEDVTIGSLSLNGAFECYVLEDPVRPDGVKIYGETAIPAGRYAVDITFSPRFKVQMPLLLNVDGYLGVRIHRHHDERKLGLMAAQIKQTALRRLDPQLHASRASGQAVAQFNRVGHHFVGTWHAVVDVERPPLATAPVDQWA